MFFQVTAAALLLQSVSGDTFLRKEPVEVTDTDPDTDTDKHLYVYPETFGNVSLSSCGDAPSCGTTMATYNGIAAKSNGGNQCTGNSCGGYGTYGYKYQCVELAQR